MVPGPFPRAKWQYPSPDQAVSLPQSEDAAGGVTEESPHFKQRDEMPLHKSLLGSQGEAFTKDLDLVWKAREDYIKTNHPHLNCKTSHDLTGIFWDMVTSAGLLGSQIYEIQEVCTGWDELQYANNAMKTLPKGLQFFAPYHPQNCPKS